MSVETPVRGLRTAWGVAAVLGVASLLLAVVLALAGRPAAPPPRPMQPLTALPDGWQLAAGQPLVTASRVPLAVSPDGGRVALVGRYRNTRENSILVYDFESGNTQPLEGTASASSVFWSPDGRTIGFISNNNTVKTVTLDGVPPVELARAEGVIAGGTWNRDGTIVVAQVALGAPGLKQVPSDGGVLRDAVPPDPEEIRAMPWFLPDGRHLLYTAFSRAVGAAGERPVAVYVGALNSAERVKLLDADARNVQYADGHLLYLRGDTLMALLSGSCIGRSSRRNGSRTSPKPSSVVAPRSGSSPGSPTITVESPRRPSYSKVAVASCGESPGYRPGRILASSAARSRASRAPRPG